MSKNKKICKFPECGRVFESRGYCASHASQLRKGQTLHVITIPLKICTFPECGRRIRKDGLCEAHNRQRQKGVQLIPIKTINKRGVGCITPQGYRRLQINGEEIYEHRLIMEQYLGRKLFDHENVHHKNGDRLDNRLTNLELWSSHQPLGQRICDKIQWAREILTMYEKDEAIINKL